MNELKIGNKTANVPIIQGGMGVGVSRSRLAGAVAAAGGIGIISTAQIGYDEAGFYTDPKKANITAIKKHIALAKAQAKGGLVGVNIMVALKDYAEQVKASIEAGADVIISGAGLPVSLPKLTEGTDTKIAPIVSTEKAAHIILKLWDRKFHRTADFIVIEGPKAGGHLGFSQEELADADQMDYDNEIRKIISAVREYEEKYHREIPVIVAGGIYSREDAFHAAELGADGIQAATRFVATEECDADIAYKMAYVKAKKEDVVIIKSPVGMPGRAIRNPFLEEVAQGTCKIERCYGCLAKCDPKEIPYCITDALIRAVKGDVEHGLIFAGENVDKVDKISTVKAVIDDLSAGFYSGEKNTFHILPHVV